MTAAELVSNLGKLSLDDFTSKTGIPVTKQLIAVGHPNRDSRVLTKFQALVVHYTANENPGATSIMNAKYFGRAWKPNPIAGKDPLEADGSAFRYGSTQVLVDMNGLTQALPLNNVSWGAGDRALPYTDQFKGQQPIAARVFGNSQNFRTLNIEVCNNDVIKNSDQDWLLGVQHAKSFCKWIIQSLGIKVNMDASLDPQNKAKTDLIKDGEILILRHHDLTGKQCPLPLIRDTNAWKQFIFDVC
jgi:N-acetylmuramoyl-L-alanine amidase CwlA